MKAREIYCPKLLSHISTALVSSILFFSCSLQKNSHSSQASKSFVSVSNPKQQLLILPDADGDGVTDQFDLEANTPPGAAVDTHGRALDTDGDGVPDYKDKEKLTSKECQPVDTNGIGWCASKPPKDSDVIVEYVDSCLKRFSASLYHTAHVLKLRLDDKKILDSAV